MTLSTDFDEDNENRFVLQISQGKGRQYLQCVMICSKI